MSMSVYRRRLGQQLSNARAAPSLTQAPTHTPGVMQYEFKFGGSPEDVSVTASGDASVSDFTQLYRELCEQPQFRPGMMVLLDLSDVDMSAIPLSEAPKLGRGLADFQERCEGCCMAIVCRDPLTSVLTRAGDFAGAQWMNVWVACSREEASAWLESQLALRG